MEAIEVSGSGGPPPSRSRESLQDGLGIVVGLLAGYLAVKALDRWVRRGR